MNVLPFVFAILLILSYGLIACFEGRLTSHRNQKAYVALRGAELKVLRQSEMDQFTTLPGVQVKKERRQGLASSNKKAEEPPPPPIPSNASCARLNLFPLIAEGKEAHLALYETAAKLLRLFYKHECFGTEKRFEYKLLDAILAGAKEKIGDKQQVPIETIALKESSLQPLYYTMLKGTKRYKLSEKGFPTLMDYCKIEKTASRICLFDCHPDMLTLFFGAKTGAKIYKELHGTEKAFKKSISLEAILHMADDPGLAFVDQGVWDLIDFKRPRHGDPSKQVILAEEDGVSIRKEVSIKRQLQNSTTVENR